MRPELEGKRVLLVGDWPPPLGGVSVHVRALRDAAQKAGAEVTVLDIGRGRHDAPGIVPAGSETQLLLSLATLSSMHDLVHLHTSGANPKSWLIVMATAACAKMLGARSLVTFHSGHGPRFLVSAQRVLFARLSLSSYDRIVCVSEEIARTFRRLGLTGTRALVAPAFGQEGLEPGPLPKELEGLRRRARPVVSAMIGEGADYGGEPMLEAFRLFLRHAPKAALVLFGPGSLEPRLVDGARRLEAPVHLLGPVEHAEALAIMKASDLFVRPTLVDGDAVSVREALSLGLRVVATRVGTRPPGVTLCLPASPADLARAMRLSMASPAPKVDAGDGIGRVLSTYASLLTADSSQAAGGHGA